MNSITAKMVKNGLGEIPGLIGELMNQLKTWQNGNYGDGLSPQHIKKLLNREQVFASTLAEQRRDFFKFLLQKNDFFLLNKDVKVPLPCHADGIPVSDDEIRLRHNNRGQMLMFCYISSLDDLNNTNIDRAHWLSSSSSMIDWKFDFAEKCYWYWIRCYGSSLQKKGDSLLASDISSASPDDIVLPTAVEYLIASRVFKFEKEESMDALSFSALRTPYANYDLMGGESFILSALDRDNMQCRYGEHKYPVTFRHVEKVV